MVLYAVEPVRPRYFSNAPPTYSSYRKHTISWWRECFFLAIYYGRSIMFQHRSTLLGKIYSNSLLLILNNRHYLAADAQKGTRGNGANNSESSNQRSRTNTFGMKAMPSYSKSMEQSSGGRFDVNLSVDKSTKSKASAWVWGSSRQCYKKLHICFLTL